MIQLDSRLSVVDGKRISQDNRKLCIISKRIKQLTSAYGFISVFYSNAIGRNMSMVSEKLLCRFYA
jgi:hypothetical protein